MKDVFLGSLFNIALAMGFLASSIAVHILFRAYYNIKIKKMKWSWELFFEGVMKLVVVALGASVLSVIFILFPIYLAMVELIADNGFIEFINVGTIILVFINPTVEYCKRNVNSLKEIIDGIDSSNDGIKKLNG